MQIPSIRFNPKRFSSQFIWVFIQFSLGMLVNMSAVAAETGIDTKPASLENYLSIKQGDISTIKIGGVNDAFYLENNKGELRELEFSYGSKEAVRVTGGIKIDSNNKVNDYFLGMIMPNDSEFKIRTLSLHDELMYRGDPSDYLLTLINAKTTEFTYMVSSKQGLFITLGKSNFPIALSVNENGIFSESLESLVDANPDMKYLDVGYFSNGLRKITASGETGWNMYFNGSAALRFVKLLLSDKLYTYSEGSGYLNDARIAELGLANQSAYDIGSSFRAEVGPVYVFSIGDNRGSISAGAFVEMASPVLSLFFSHNKTSTGYDFTTPQVFDYGAVFSAAISF